MARFISKFLQKRAYGLDMSGEVFEGSGGIAEQENLEHSSQPQQHHETPPNPANLTVDSEAEKEFPELAVAKHTQVHWPPRTR